MASQNSQAGNSESEKAYVLAGQPVGWAGMAKDVREFDQEEVKQGKEDVDTLLVFVSTCAVTLFVRSVSNLHYTHIGWSLLRCSCLFPGRSLPQSTALANGYDEPHSGAYRESDVQLQLY